MISPLFHSPWTILAAPLVLCGLLLGLALWAKVPLKYNIRNLKVRWWTTLLTALAFTLVIGLLTVMLAFVNGMYALTESSGQPANVLVLSEGATDEAFSNLGFADLGDIETQTGIVRENNQPLTSREVYLSVSQPIENPAAGRPGRRFLQIRGVDDPASSAKVHDLQLYPGGRWFSAAGVQELTQTADQATPAIEVVLGEGIARELAKDNPKLRDIRSARLDVGDSFSLAERQWLVVGVMSSSGTVHDSEVWAKRAIVGPLFGKDTYSSVVLRTADAASAKALQQYFANQYTKAQLEAFTEPEYFSSLGETNRQFLFGIFVVTVIMAVGGVMGVMNTMFASVSQRTKDIGVLRLLGFARWRILVSFLVESVMIAVLGGALGCALGSLVHGWTATSIVSSGPGGKSVVLHLRVDATILAVGMLLSLAMGFLGGLLPAMMRAIRLKPLEALR